MRALISSAAAAAAPLATGEVLDELMVVLKCDAWWWRPPLDAPQPAAAAAPLSLETVVTVVVQMVWLSCPGLAREKGKKIHWLYLWHIIAIAPNFFAIWYVLYYNCNETKDNTKSSVLFIQDPRAAVPTKFLNFIRKFLLADFILILRCT